MKNNEKNNNEKNKWEFDFKSHTFIIIQYIRLINIKCLIYFLLSLFFQKQKFISTNYILFFKVILILFYEHCAFLYIVWYIQYKYQ